MIDIKETVVIDRGIQAVWDWIMDPTNQASWQGSVLEVRFEPADEPVGLGTRYIETRQFLGKRFETIFEVIEFDAPHRSAIDLVSGPINGRSSFELQELGERTGLTLGARVDTGTFFKVAEPALRSYFKRELSSYIHALKMLVEAPAKV